MQAESEEIAALVASPRRQLAFRTLAHIRVGVLPGELLVDLERDPVDQSRWIQELLADSRARERVVAEIHAVGREVAPDPKLGQEEPAPDADAKRSSQA